MRVIDHGGFRTGSADVLVSLRLPFERSADLDGVAKRTGEKDVPLRRDLTSKLRLPKSKLDVPECLGRFAPSGGVDIMAIVFSATRSSDPRQKELHGSLHSFS